MTAGRIDPVGVPQSGESGRSRALNLTHCVATYSSLHAQMVVIVDVGVTR